MSGYYSTNGGWHVFRLVADEKPTGYSGPYVVIDPEDREAVERLGAAFSAHCGWTSYGSVVRAERLQAALREYANPKPPKCGAVLSLAGLSYRCELDGDHDEPHSNDTARALWGERE